MEEVICEDDWTWNGRDKSYEVHLHGSNSRIALFHPNWSFGAAAVRGTRTLNHGRFYWEVVIPDACGTSMMLGVATRKARLYVNKFTHLLGEDQHSWGLSHRGFLCHGGECEQYTSPFNDSEPVTVGMYFDGPNGTLTYYKDGVCLGVAFTGLHKVQEPLYPIICSTTARTEMRLVTTRRDFITLQERSRAAILKRIRNNDDIEQLKIPTRMKLYLHEGFEQRQQNIKHKSHCAIKRTVHSSDDHCKKTLPSCNFL